MSSRQTRRDFLATTGMLAGSLALASAPRVHAAEDNTIKIAVVGCGGRGTGAVLDALQTQGPKKLVAMADAFADRVENSYQSLLATRKDEIDVPAERRFVGLDGFKHAIDAVAPGGVVLLATAPAFRPRHVEYAVSKGVHVFMEKSFGVDAPGVRRIMAAGEEADRKGLKIVGGLMSRHSKPLEETVARLHDGIIGERITCWSYRVHGPVGLSPKREGENDLAHQIRNYSNFTWLNGSFLLDWLIHNLDVSCWAKGSYPVSARGFGGRQQRKVKDQLYDHYSVEYAFSDGTRLMAQCGHMNNIWNTFQCTIHGQTGCAIIGEGVVHPKIYKGHLPLEKNKIWEFQGQAKGQYQVEHDILFDAVRNDKPCNETPRCCNTTLTGILGRMALESGKELSWDDVAASTVELAPGLDTLDWNGPPPVVPDAEGNYPVAVPGETG